MELIWLIVIWATFLANWLLIILTLLTVVKHIKAKKYEFFFIVIMVSIPAAYLIGNFYDVNMYWLGLQSESVIINNKKYDDDLVKTSFWWIPLLLIYTVGLAYLFRMLTYHHFIDSGTLRMSWNSSKIKKLP